LFRGIASISDEREFKDLAEDYSGNKVFETNNIAFGFSFK